jgi:2'-5' RNA ligase
MYVVIAPIPEDLAAAVQPYRERYDPLAGALPPHITILNPFEFSDPPQILYNHLVEIGETYAPIKVSVAGWDIYRYIDYQLRLPIIAGRAELTALRDDLLTGPLSYCPGQDKDYWPHLFLGKFNDEAQVAQVRKDLDRFEAQFIFRVTHLELWQWYKPDHPWEIRKRFGLEATLSSAHRSERKRRAHNHDTPGI